MNNQSTVIFGFIIAAFFIFITIKGELSTYAGLLLLSPQGSGNTGRGTASTNSTSSDITSTIIKGAIEASVL